MNIVNQHIHIFGLFVLSTGLCRCQQNRGMKQKSRSLWVLRLQVLLHLGNHITSVALSPQPNAVLGTQDIQRNKT